MSTNWRKLILFPAVLLVLAACSDATGPRLPGPGDEPKEPPPGNEAFLDTGAQRVAWLA